MDLTAVHVAAAVIALAVGAALLVGRKGDRRHAAVGRLYLAVMLAVNVPALLVYDDTGGPGAFHVLAVVSLATTAAGWWSLRRRSGGRRAVGAHGALMTWSWIGVATAGLARLADQRWPDASPWPVLLVVGVATAAGLVLVPGLVERQLVVRGRPGRG